MKLITLFLFLAFSLASACGQTINAPAIFMVGDTFNYHTYNSISDAKSGNYKVAKMSQMAKRIEENGNTFFEINGSSDDFIVLDSNANMVKKKFGTPVTQIYSPSNYELRFPLTVGTKYEISSTNNHRDGDGKNVECKGALRVVDWEEVTVPAGKFNALHIEIDQMCNILPANIIVREGVNMWITPETKMRPVLYSSVYKWGRSGVELLFYSLTNFELKK